VKSPIVLSIILFSSVAAVHAQDASSALRQTAPAREDTRNQLKLSGEISVDGNVVSAPRAAVANNQAFKMAIGKKITIAKDGGSADVSDTVDNERPSFLLECTPIASGDEWSASCDLSLQWSKDGKQFDRKVAAALKSRLGQRAEAIEKFVDNHEVKLALTVTRSE
jgi:hypothetical protein